MTSATVDNTGRILIPKALRERLGMTAGTKVDISWYGDGLHLVIGGRTAEIVERDKLLVAEGGTEFGDDEMFALIDAGRR